MSPTIVYRNSGLGGNQEQISSKHYSPVEGLASGPPWLQEFADSAIGPELALGNVRWIEGPQAVEEFLESTIARRQKNRSYITGGNARLIERYQFLEDGGWVAYGAALDGGTGQVPYLKPATPRPNPEKPGKFIKYEMPPEMEARPVLPCIPWMFGLRIAENFGHGTDYRERYNHCHQGGGEIDIYDFDGLVRGRSTSSSSPIGFGDLDNSQRADRGSESDVSLPRQSGNGEDRGRVGREAAHRSVPSIETRDSADKGFWRWWQSKGSPAICITEGLKKALALIEQGYPALALRGATQWHPAGSKELWPELASLCTDRTFIAFDQDDAAKTRATVSRQAQLMANAIERAGGMPRFMLWPAALGKGLDDVLAGLPPEARRGWLSGAIAKALTPKKFRRVATVATAKAILGTSAPLAQRETTDDYLPQLPPLTPGAIHWIDAGMGSGKTYRQGRDWVRPWAEAGGATVVLSPLNSLGQQTGQDWGIPHIHDYGTDAASQQALQADISHRGGLVACLNSVHRVLSLIPQDAPVLLILDEAAQTFTDAVEGGTLKGEWAARWEDAIALMQRADTGGAIALAEDGIDQATIDLVKTLSGAAQTIGIRHTREATPWPVTLCKATPLSGWRAELTQALRNGDRILYVSTSQKEGRRLEAWGISAGIDVVRIDSETNEGGRYREFFEAPDPWLYKQLPQLVILSPSGKTGLSIEGGISAAGAFFDSVWGYFPSLDTDTAMQLLGRYRPPVPRHIWAPAYINPEPGEGPGRLSITHELSTAAALYASYGGFEQAPTDSHDQAIKTYLAARRQRRWAQKIHAAEALCDRLEASGHQVEVVTGGKSNEKITAEWNEIKEKLAQNDAAIYAGVEIDPEIHTPEWASKVLRSTESTHELRCKAGKVRMVARFPGLDWNDAQLWYEAEFCPGYDVTAKAPSRGPLAPGAAVWAEAGHWSTLWAENAKEAQQVLSQRLKAAHLLPQSGPRAMLAAIFRPLVEQLLAAGEVTPCGNVESQIKAQALKYRAELARYWRLTIAEAQTDTAIANKIARKFGLVLERSRRVTVATKKLWVYSLRASDTWLALVAARESALKQECTNSLERAFNTFVHSPPHGNSGAAARPPGCAESPPDLGELGAS